MNARGTASIMIKRTHVIIGRLAGDAWPNAPPPMQLQQLATNNFAGCMTSGPPIIIIIPNQKSYFRGTTTTLQNLIETVKGKLNYNFMRIAYTLDPCFVGGGGGKTAQKAHDSYNSKSSPPLLLQLKTASNEHVAGFSFNYKNGQRSNNFEIWI